MSGPSARSPQLLCELLAAERAASRTPRREAARLEGTPPASAMRAVSAHADETLDALARFDGAKRTRDGVLLWSALGFVAGAVRDAVRDRLEDVPHAYRRALLELRRGLDLVRLLRASAREEGDLELVDFCDRWLGVRLRLVAGVEAELEWLGRHDDVVLRAARRRAARALLFVTTTLGAGAACEQTSTEPGGAAATSPPPAPTGPGGLAPPPPTGPGPTTTEAPSPTLAAVDAGGTTQAPPPFVHVDVNHVLSTGQSNSVANDGKPVLSVAQPFQNLMFDVGVMTGAQCDGDGCRGYEAPRGFVPLVEGDQFFAGSPVETMSSSLANTVSRLARDGALAGTGDASHDVLVSLHGRSGNSYWCLRKGGCPWWTDRGYVKPWDDGMRQVADAARLAAAAGKSYAVRAVTAIHGEHDHYAWSSGASLFPLPRTDGQGMVADYGEALLEWQRDYEMEVRAITGQTISPPLLVSQYSHWNDVPTTVIAYQQLRAHVASGGKVLVVGPTYALPYSTTCLHFTGAGERWLGEYFGKVYARVVLERRPWEPLRPIAIARTGATIAVRYVVPSPPLVLDTEHVRDPGDRGFEVVDARGDRQKIADVSVTGQDTVTITLADPAAAAARVRYAYTFTGCGGSGTLARGNVRDSDPTPSAYGNALWNWSVHFDEPIP